MESNNNIPKENIKENDDEQTPKFSDYSESMDADQSVSTSTTLL